VKKRKTRRSGPGKTKRKIISDEIKSGQNGTAKRTKRELPQHLKQINAKIKAKAEANGDSSMNDNQSNLPIVNSLAME
jgi:hypothetical protein